MCKKQVSAVKYLKYILWKAQRGQIWFLQCFCNLWILLKNVMNISQNSQSENTVSRTWSNQMQISCTCDWGEEDSHQQCEGGGDVRKNVGMVGWCWVDVIGGPQEVFLHNVSFAEVVAPQVLCGQWTVLNAEKHPRVDSVKQLQFYQLNKWRASCYLWWCHWPDPGCLWSQ